MFSCYFNSKKYDKALSISDWIINKEPDNIKFYIKRAVLYNSMYDSKYAYNYLITLRDKFKNNSDLEKYIKAYDPSRT